MDENPASPETDTDEAVASLRRSLARRDQELIVMRRLGQAIISSLDLPQILTIVCQEAVQLLEATSAYISRWDETRHTTTVIAEHASDEASTEENDPDLSHRWTGHMEKYGAKSPIVIPLKVRDHVIGSLEIWESRTGRAFTERELLVAQSLADYAAAAIENDRLHKETQRRLERTRVHQAVMRATSSTLDFDQVLERTCDILQTVREIDFLGFAFPVIREDILRFHPAHVGPPDLAKDVSVSLNDGLCGEAFRTGKAVMMIEGHETPSSHTVLAGTRSQLAIPFQAGGEVLGILDVESQQADAFDSEELTFYSAIAGRLGAALENTRLYTTAQARAQQMARLNEIGRALTSSLDFPTVLRAALSQVQRLFLSESVLLFQHDAATGDLELLRAMVGMEQVAIDARLEKGEGISGWAFAQRQPVLVEDAQEDARFSPLEDRCPGGPTRAMMVVPLLTPEHAIGAITVGSEERGIYTRREFQTFQTLASTLAVALENAHLYEEQRVLLREREEAQAQLIQAEKMAALGRLAASVAHEINNPLQSVVGCLGLAQEALDEALEGREETDEYLQVAREEVRRVARTVSQMRDLSRPTPARREPADINELLERVLRLSEKQCKDNGVKVAWEPAVDLPPVPVVGDQIQQVFLNLLLNAVEAMPQGGQLKVQTASTRTPEGVEIRFGDTGMGIAPEALPHIFEPFYSTKSEGTGLGLATSYTILKSHGGRIDVESEVGEGSVFIVWLPGRRDGGLV